MLLCFFMFFLTIFYIICVDSEKHKMGGEQGKNNSQKFSKLFFYFFEKIIFKIYTF